MPFTSLSGEDSTDEFSFIVYGDIQDNYKGGHDRLVERMLDEPARFVLNTGDISKHGGKHYERDFFPTIAKLARRVPYFPAVGNHDIAWGSPFSRYPFYVFFRNTLQYLGRKEGNGHLLTRASQKIWYSFVYGNTLFVALDSNLFIDEGKYRRTHSLDTYRDHTADQLDWLVGVLQKAHANPKIAAKFVYFHHSPFVSYQKDPVPLLGIGGHPNHSEMLVEQRVSGANGSISSYFLDLFREYNVTAVFTGHEHFYERWREVILDSDRRVQTLNWVVTGMGGVKPRGKPEYETDEIDEVLEEDYYQDYVQRVRRLNAGWTSTLQHAFPNEDHREGRFHSYLLVTVRGEEVFFETKDIFGEVRDRGYFQASLPFLPADQ